VAVAASATGKNGVSRGSDGRGDARAAPIETDERTVERVDESRGADQRDRRRDDRRDICPAKP
jgi:hypothetical protein